MGHLVVSVDGFGCHNGVGEQGRKQGRKVTIVFSGQARGFVKKGIALHRKEFSRHVNSTDFEKPCLTFSL